MAIANAYNPNPQSTEEILKRRQAQVDSARESGLIKEETPYVPNPRVLGVEITPDSPDKNLLSKIGEDAAMLAYAIPTGIAQAVTHPIKFLKSAVMNEEGDITRGALGQSVRDAVNPDYYKAHPLLGVVNLAGFIMPIAGAAKAAALKTATKTALTVAFKEATLLGIEESLVKGAFKESVFKVAVREAAKTGETGIVSETVRGSLVRAGVAEDVALRVGTSVADNLYTTFSRQTTKLKVLESIAHPVGSGYRYLSGKADPLRSAIFGDAAKTAVGELYGADLVRRNPEGFLPIERWAEAQANERGLANTMQNRLRVMQDWTEQNSQWASLNPEQKVAHFKNYAEQDLLRLKLHGVTGMDIVTTKSLPQSYVDAMVETIKHAPDDVDLPTLTKLMEDNFGNDFKIHNAEVESALMRRTISEKTALVKRYENAAEFTNPQTTPLRDSQYAILTAENPGGVQLSPAENAARNVELMKELKAKGFKVIPVEGKYGGNPEHSFIVLGITEEEAMRVAKFGLVDGQESILTSKGLIYADGTVNPADTSKINFDSAQTDYFSKVKVGGKEVKFAVPIDFEKRVPLASIPSVAKESLGAIKHRMIEAVSKLGSSRSNISFAKFSPEVQELAAKLEQTGYRIGYAPTNKQVSFATDVMQVSERAGESAVTHSDLMARRTAFGKWIEKLGLSPRGTIEGAAEFSYRESFTQTALQELGKKYGGIIRVGKVSIPIEKLFEWIDGNKQLLQQSRKKLTLPIRTVFDVKADDLVRAGFAPEIAGAIEKISKRALREIPTSITGMGDTVINYMKTMDKGFGKYMSSWYDKYLKAAYKGRYDWSPFFSAQEFLETKLNSALLLKDPRILPGSRAVARLGDWTAGKLGRHLEGTRTYLRKIVDEPPIEDIAAVREEVLGTLQKTMLDYTSTPDLINIQNAAKGGYALLKDKAAFEQSVRSRNLWYAAFGQSSVRIATTFNKALAEKFGMTIGEALNFTYENGVKKYTNPKMVAMMREMTQSAFHYKVGVLTSPLVKTLNIVWFPLRFQMKTISLAAKWMDSLSPASKMIFMNNWVHFANWAGTDEGIEWRRTNRNVLYNILAYTTAYEQIGQSIEAVTKGRLFGGNAGLIGGVPFGFVVNLARELAILPEDPDQFDPKTGTRFTKQTPRDVVSAASLSNAIEQLIISMSPSTPFYSLTGGVIGGVSPRKWIESLTRQVVGASREALEGRDPARGRQQLERDFKRVPLDYSRLAE